MTGKSVTCHFVCRWPSTHFSVLPDSGTITLIMLTVMIIMARVTRWTAGELIYQDVFCAHVLPCRDRPVPGAPSVISWLCTLVREQQEAVRLSSTGSAVLTVSLALDHIPACLPKIRRVLIKRIDKDHWALQLPALNPKQNPVREAKEVLQTDAAV